MPTGTGTRPPHHRRAEAKIGVGGAAGRFEDVPVPEERREVACEGSVSQLPTSQQHVRDPGMHTHTGELPAVRRHHAIPVDRVELTKQLRRVRER